MIIFVYALFIELNVPETLPEIVGLLGVSLFGCDISADEPPNFFLYFIIFYYNI